MKKQIITLGLCLVSLNAMASVQLSKTRIIIDEAVGAGSITAVNSDPKPYVLQSWVEGMQGEMDTPFFVTPPLSRLDSGGERAFNIRRIQNTLPTDRESLFWFNMLEVPPKGQTSENALSFAIQSSLKIIYRPAAIKDIDQSKGDLDFAISKNSGQCALVVKNNSPYIVNFSTIKIDSKNKEVAPKDIGMPFSTIRIAIDSCPPQGKKTTIQPSIINDYGGLSVWPNQEITVSY